MEPERQKVRFGVEVKVARARQGMRQVDLARSADLSDTYISEIENGRRDPSLTTIHKLAGALDIDPCDLLAYGERRE